MLERGTVSQVCGSKVFSVTCEGLSRTSELVARGKCDWSKDRITDERFPLVEHRSVERQIELIEVDHDLTTVEVLIEFGHRNLECPTYEDALYFEIQHPEEQRKHAIVFLHDPVRDPDGCRSVLVLDGDARRRDLCLVQFIQKWTRRCTFAAVRK